MEKPLLRVIPISQQGPRDLSVKEVTKYYHRDYEEFS